MQPVWCSCSNIIRRRSMGKYPERCQELSCFNWPSPASLWRNHWFVSLLTAVKWASVFFNMVVGARNYPWLISSSGADRVCRGGHFIAKLILATDILKKLSRLNHGVLRHFVLCSEFQHLQFLLSFLNKTLPTNLMSPESHQGLAWGGWESNGLGNAVCAL